MDTLKTKSDFSSVGLATIVVGIYLLCVELFFFPCLRSLNSQIIGLPADNMQHYWGLWWANKAFSTNLDFTHTNFIYHPQGASLFFQPFCFYNVFLSLGLTHLFSLPLTYNFIILHTFVLAGLGAFLLARYLTGNIYASIIAGFIFAFNPSHFAHSLHHDETASIQFIPFFVLYFIRSMKGGTTKDLALACLFFFLTSISTWYYMVHTLIFIGLSYIYLAWRREQFILKDVLFKMMMIVGVTAVLLLPWFLQMFKLWNSNAGMIERGGHGSAVADLLSFLVPHPNHWLAQFSQIKNINDMFTGNAWNKTVYLGGICLILSIVAFWKNRQATGKYFLGLLVFCILSLGEFLHILGHKVQFTLPYALIKITPFLKAARYPSRFIVFSYLFLAIIVAFAIKFICTLPAIRRYILLCILTPLIFLDFYTINRTMTEIKLPSCYLAIMKDKEQFGILDLPIENRTNLKRYMTYQTMHGLPTVTGDILRRVDSSLIDRLELTDLTIQHKELKDNGIKYIIIHNAFEENFPVGIGSYRKEYKNVFENNDNIIFQVY